MQQNFYLQSEEFNDYMRLINAKRHRIDFLFKAYLLKHGTQKDVARYGNLVVCIPNLFKCITEKSRHRCIHHTQINVREVKAQVYTPHSNKCQRSQGTGVYTTLKYTIEKLRHRCIHHTQINVREVKAQVYTPLSFSEPACSQSVHFVL